MSSISSIKLYINGDDYISIHTAVKKYSAFLMMKLSKLGDCSVLLENQRNGMKMSYMYYISDFCSKVYILNVWLRCLVWYSASGFQCIALSFYPIHRQSWGNNLGHI